MGRFSDKRKIECYHKIFDEIYKDHTINILDISANVQLSRNTVSLYLRRMYAQDIMVGPRIEMNPAPNYKEYIYLMNFADPFKVFSGLKGFPHVLYHAMTFGDWNTMAITDRHLDFSKLVGYQDMIVQEMKGGSYTPHVELVTLREGFKKARNYLDQFTPEHTETREKRLEVPLKWGEDQWKLFYAFRNGTRKKITPLLRKIKVRFETYGTWMRALTDYCTIHTGIYPEGYYTYLTYCFLFSSDYESTLKSVFSSFSTTPFMVEMGDQLLVFTTMALSGITEELFCIIYDMKEKGIIREFKQTVVLFQSHH